MPGLQDVIMPQNKVAMMNPEMLMPQTQPVPGNVAMMNPQMLQQNMMQGGGGGMPVNPQMAGVLGQMLMQQQQQRPQPAIGRLAQPKGIPNPQQTVDPMALRRIMLQEYLRRMPQGFQAQGVR